MGSLLGLTEQGRLEVGRLLASPTTHALVLDESAEGFLLKAELSKLRLFVAEWPEGSLDAVPRFALSLASLRLQREALQSLENHRALLRETSDEFVPPASVLVFRRAPFTSGDGEEPWQPYARDETAINTMVRRAHELTPSKEWVEPVTNGSQAQVDRWWELAEHDPDAFELGAVACRLGASEKSLSWRAKDLLARQVQQHLPVEVARVFDLLIAHGRAVEERLFIEVTRVALGLTAKPLNELIDLGLVRRLGPMVTFLPAGFSCESDVLAMREQLANTLVQIAREPAQRLGPAAILEAHRHLAAIPTRRADALEFARYGAHELVGAARTLSLNAAAQGEASQFLEAASLFDGVERIARDVGDAELRAYGIHYGTYNRARARAIEPRLMRSGYRRSVVLWPENGLFWIRSIRTLAIGNSWQLEDPSAAQAAIDEARAVVAKPYFEDYVLPRIAIQLDQRKDLLLPLFTGIPEAKASIARLQDSTGFGQVTRRLWLRGDVRLGFLRGWYFTWRRDASETDWRADIVPPGRSDIVCTGRGASLVDAYESMTGDALAHVERSLCTASGGRSLDLDTVWMRGGASRSRWLVALHELRGFANEQARALHRLRDSVLTQLESLGGERPTLSYDHADDRVELRWISPDRREGILVASFQGNDACELKWIEDGAPGPVPLLRGATGHWLKALGCSQAAAPSGPEAPLPEALARAREAGAAVYRYRGTREGGVRDLHEREVFTRDECGQGTVYFVDLYPGHGWSHPCRYAVLGNDGSSKEVRRNWPPRSMSEWVPA